MAVFSGMGFFTAVSTRISIVHFGGVTVAISQTFIKKMMCHELSKDDKYKKVNLKCQLFRFARIGTTTHQKTSACRGTEIGDAASSCSVVLVSLTILKRAVNKNTKCSP